MVKIHDFGKKECPIVLINLGQEVLKNKDIIPVVKENSKYIY